LYRGIHIWDCRRGCSEASSPLGCPMVDCSCHDWSQLLTHLVHTLLYMSPAFVFVCTWAQDERPADLHMAQPNVPVSKTLIWLRVVNMSWRPVPETWFSVRPSRDVGCMAGVSYSTGLVNCSVHIFVGHCGGLCT
jgi:hypothetical protein